MKYLYLFFIIYFFYSCGTDMSTSENDFDKKNSPLIESVYPNESDTSISVNTTISFTFTESLNTSSVTFK